MQPGPCLIRHGQLRQLERQISEEMISRRAPLLCLSPISNVSLQQACLMASSLNTL